MKGKYLSIFIIILLLNSLLFSEKKIKEENLSSQYKEWLKLVRYIILPAEENIFMQLLNDRDRDIFIETFWKQRDPTPGTPENEFKEEHIKRFNYANEHYRRGSTREGWMTDMGEIYIILGPPASIERFESASFVYPCQAWYYYGDPKKELPSHFGLLFVQRRGFGEYKLYDPVTDGPASLIIDKKDIDETDYEDLYNKIKERAPTLADLSISLIPGEYNYDYSPSPRNNLILASIYESPKKAVNPSYATNFLNYKGLVSVEYATNYVECDYGISLMKEPALELNFLHFSISPKKISVDYYEPKDQYYFNYRLSVSLKKGESIVFQYTKDYPFYFNPDEIERVKSGGVSIQDSFPILEGNYIATILIQNSVGKEFSYFEKAISISEELSKPFILGPVLGYDLQEDKALTHVAYKFTGTRLLVDPKNAFSVNDSINLCFVIINVSRALWENGSVEILVKGHREEDAQGKILKSTLKDYPYSEAITIVKSIPAQELTPDYYELNLMLKDGLGQIFDSKKLNISVSQSPDLSHPTILSKTLPLTNEFLFYFMLANQADKMNDNQKAEVYFERLFEIRPDYIEGIIPYANFLLRTKKFQRALEYAEKLRDDSKRKFDYFLLKGQALTGLEKFSEAVVSLLEANKIYNSDVRVLNSLGFCYLKIGKREESLQALKASLALNPQQSQVKKLIEAIEGSKK